MTVTLTETTSSDKSRGFNVAVIIAVPLLLAIIFPVLLSTVAIEGLLLFHTTFY